MSKKKVARPGVTSTETGGKSAIKVHSYSHVDLRLSHSHCTTGKAARQAGITDFLPHGKENAMSARELAALAGTHPRAVTQAIERARRDGEAILSDGNGYWISGDAAEIRRFVRSMRHRAREIEMTARAVERGGGYYV